MQIGSSSSGPFLLFNVSDDPFFGGGNISKVLTSSNISQKTSFQFQCVSYLLLAFRLSTSLAGNGMAPEVELLNALSPEQLVQVWRGWDDIGPGESSPYEMHWRTIDIKII